MHALWSPKLHPWSLLHCSVAELELSVSSTECCLPSQGMLESWQCCLLWVSTGPVNSGYQKPGLEGWVPPLGRNLIFGLLVVAAGAANIILPWTTCYWFTNNLTFYFMTCSVSSPGFLPLHICNVCIKFLHNATHETVLTYAVCLVWWNLDNYCVAGTVVIMTPTLWWIYNNLVGVGVITEAGPASLSWVCLGQVHSSPLGFWASQSEFSSRRRELSWQISQNAKG